LTSRNHYTKGKSIDNNYTLTVTLSLVKFNLMQHLVSLIQAFPFVFDAVAGKMDVKDPIRLKNEPTCVANVYGTSGLAV